MIRKNTSQRGVDIILTSQPNDLFHGSLYHALKCLADGGQFIEIASADFMKKPALDLDKSCSFHSITFDRLLKAPPSLKQEINALIRDGLYKF